MTISGLTKELQKNKVTAEVYITNEEGERIYSNSANEVCECPEDGTFFRDLLDCYDLLSAFKLGYELAGGKEEDIELIEEEAD